MRLYAAMVFLCSLSGSATAFAQAVPDGTTATSAVTDGAGKITVNIAPAISDGISHNRYNQFSVPQAGMDLDNRTQAARTILNEVTSSNTTSIRGRLEVLGQSSHVIVANPNGVSVDGGTFVNTGGVVLSTGTPTLITRPTAPGFTQDNILLSTTDGSIDVGAAGLSGAMTSLQLLSKRVRIDGPVENTSTNTRSDIRVVVGGSEVEYDSSILPISDLEDWGQVKKQGTADGALALEITERGSLTANRVTVVSTNGGAGVSHAGSSLASIGDFTIDVNGRVSTKGANIKAARNVKIKARSIKVASTVRQPQARIEAVSGALTMLAETGGIENTGVLLSGNDRDAADTDSRGGATLKAATDISLLTENADQLAIAFASTGDLLIEADGKITNNTGRFLSNAETRLIAGDAIVNKIDVTGGSGRSGVISTTIRKGKRLWYSLWTKRKTVETINIDYGAPRVADQLAFIVGNSIDIRSPVSFSNLGGELNANDGDITIDAREVLNAASYAGSANFVRVCYLTCSGSGEADVSLTGGNLNASGDITIVASGNYADRGGQLTSLQNVNVTSPVVLLEGQRVPTIVNRPSGLYNFWSGTFPWIYYEDQGATIIAPDGDIRIEAFSPINVNAGVLQAGGDVIIPSGTIVSPPSIVSPVGSQPIGLFKDLVQ